MERFLLLVREDLKRIGRLSTEGSSFGLKDLDNGRLVKSLGEVGHYRVGGETAGHYGKICYTE